MRTTRYFETLRDRSDRSWILREWIQETIDDPQREAVQSDGRLRRWRRIPEAGGRILRVVLLPDGETVHNAFFDRNVAL